MSFSVCICKRQTIDAHPLADFVTAYFENQEIPVCVNIFHGIKNISMFAEKKTIDILLIDLYFVSKEIVTETITFIKHLLELQPHMQIIFMTPPEKYTSALYHVSHAYCLLYPLCNENLSDALAIAEKNVLQKRPKTILVKSLRAIMRIHIDDILYVEKDKRKITIHTKKEDIDSYMPIETLLEKLDNRFLHCHKSFIVNLETVEKFERRRFYCQNDVVIPISQLRYSQTKEEFLSYTMLKKV